MCWPVFRAGEAPPEDAQTQDAGKNTDTPKNTGVDDMSEENHALKNHSFARISGGFSHVSFWLHSLLADAFRMPRAYGGEYCSSVATHTWMITISIEEDRTIPTLRPPKTNISPKKGTSSIGNTSSN